MPGLNKLFNTLTGKGSNNRDHRGETALFKAVRAGSLREVRRLLAQGADPNIVDATGTTPLHIAAYWGENEMIKALIKAGAATEARDETGATPLHIAALSGGARAHGRTIALLIASGARQDVVDTHGWTPADYMQLWEKNAAAAEKLVAYRGLKKNRPDKTAPKADKTLRPPSASH